MDVATIKKINLVESIIRLAQQISFTSLTRRQPGLFMTQHVVARVTVARHRRPVNI